MDIFKDDYSNMITVRMADYKVARGDQKLITRDLGSCIGIAIRDPRTGIGGLLHAMLPTTLIKKDLPPEQFPKYVDTGLDVMLREMEKLGANRRYMEAKMAGAAHIIQYQSVSPTRDISSRNIQMAVEYLEKHKIKIISMEVGDRYPRTVIFEPGSGKTVIKTFGKQDRYL